MALYSPIMNLAPHHLRPLSNLLHAVAMLPIMPLFIARPIAKLASKLYYKVA